MAKTAFVTGNRGFIGTHITRELIKRGYRVLGVDKTAVDDAQACFRRLSDRFDLVVHCAYVVGGRATIDGRNTALIENTLLDSMMFDWALKTKQKRVLYFSSSAAYPVDLQSYSGYEGVRLEEDWIDFDNIRQPDSHYGAAKLHGERLARVYAENGGRVHVVRPFSGCHYSQSLDYPWPSIARRVVEGDFTVWGGPGQSRDWIDISDVLNGALAVVDNDERRPVNLCTGVATEFGDLMKQMSKRWNGYEPEIKYLEDRPTGVFYRVGDPSRMLEHYMPQKSLEQMIDETMSQKRGD